MRVLLDECVTWELRRYLPEHDVYTARYMGWDGKVNGDLLMLARDEFDVLITVDQGIENQQNITDEDVAVIVLKAKSNSIDDLMPLVPRLTNHLYTVKRGDVIEIEP